MQNFIRRISIVGVLLSIASAAPVWADTAPQTLPFTQNWSNTGLITSDDNWSGVPGIVGYRGDGLASATGADPRNIVTEGATPVVDVNANQTNPATFNTGGVAEFHLADPTIAFKGSGTARAPSIVVFLNTTGRTGIRVQLNLRDIDSSTNNTANQVSIQYRVGNSGNFTSVYYVADATAGPSLATLVTPVDVTLPAAADNQPLVQVRIITTDAPATDEWVGIDDINITGSAGTLTLSPSTLPNGAAGATYSQVLTAVNNQGQSCTFNSTGALPDGLTLNSATADTVTLSGTATTAGTFSFNITADCGTAGSINPGYVVIIGAPAFTCETGAKTSTAIHTIQGSGASSPRSGQIVEVEGIVVGAFEGSAGLSGFYLQEPYASWDIDPATSEGIFVYEGSTVRNVHVGDRVRVRGTVAEYSSSGSFLGSTRSSSLTEIGTIASFAACSAGNSFERPVVTLPAADPGDLERYEGMAVQLTQPLVVTGNFSLGTFGQVDLAPAVLFNPTTSPNAAIWAGQASLNQRSVIALDDGSALSNETLFPAIFPSGGLSASNTLRVGSKVAAPLAGVLDDRFGEYRIQTTVSPSFSNDNPRPAIAPILTRVGGRFRAVSANVLNFFTVFGSRGAANQTEFDRQKTKVVEALFGMKGDIYGLSEIQNFANGQPNGGTYTNAALQSLVDGLNCKASGLDPLCTVPTVAPFSFVDTLGLGTSNGTDAIRSAIIYRPAALLPVGQPVAYYQNDSNRPTLAQTFKPAVGAKPDIQTFTFVVNHFRSKGSACGGASDDPFQGNCNGLRLDMATNVMNWLAGNPTADPGAAPRRQLLVGDFNAYFGEDPIQYFVTHGYTNLIQSVIGSGAYSYNFGSQAGYLDHALANTAMNSLVRSVAEWHNNADEPSSLQALDSDKKSAAAQAAYYAADPFASADHDPIVIGFNPLSGDLNDDGVVNASDQSLITASVGKDASQVDRRMDFDGDGKITLNDYRAWAVYYKAYLK